MIQLAYASTTKGRLGPMEIVDILLVSRERNGKRGITGMLLYKNGTVLQVLEGEKEDVVALFEVIRKDGRHGDVIELYQRDITEREFPNWTMGFHDLNAESVRGLKGVNEFLDPAVEMHTLKPTSAAKLLNYFKTHVR